MIESNDWQEFEDEDSTRSVSSWPVDEDTHHVRDFIVILFALFIFYMVTFL